MESLVNYSSEDEQDDYPYKKVAVRERSSGGAVSSGRTTTEVTGPLKRSYEQTKIDSFECETSYRKGRDTGKDSYKGGSSGYNEDKYKYDRKAENSREHKEKRDAKESRHNRDTRDDERDYESRKKHEHKKIDDHKPFREHRREYKRDSNDYSRDEKKYNRYEDRKSSNTASNKDRFSNARSRVDERKHYDERYNDEKRGANVSITDDRRKEYNDRRTYNNDDDRRNDRRNDDRRSQRSYNDDRSNAYRPRRSPSPIPSHHNKGSKYSDRKEESNTRRDRKRYSRSRSKTRSRSPSPEKPIESYSTLTKTSNQRTAPGEHLVNLKRPDEDPSNCEKKILPIARNFEALLTLPLSENAPKHPNVVTVPATSAAAESNTTTVQLPSYYNPNVINPNKYVEQMQKRKLIWGAKKVEDSASKWGHAQFSQDQDGKVASKFMRLMGMKNTSSTGGESSTLPNESEKKPQPAASPQNNTDVKSREAMFTTMEHQYEVARQVTHTMRGVGLGFSSQSRPY